VYDSELSVEELVDGMATEEGAPTRR
jgi:hypothetical protein